MASILELVFNRKVTIQDVTAWLTKENSCSTLDGSSFVQAEFVQYFLNFMRDQSAPILQGCRSANATPSKTPTVLKSQRSITFRDPSTSTPRTSGDSKRVQLFAANPLEGDSLTHPINETKATTSQDDVSSNYPSFNSSRNANVHENHGWSLNNSPNTMATRHIQMNESNNHLQHSPLTGTQQQTSSHHGSVNRRSANRSTPDSSVQGKRHRNNSFTSVYTPDSLRSQHKHSLGEFVVVTTTRKKKSPTTIRQGDISLQISPGGWKPGGKGKDYGSSERKRWQSVLADTGSPVFALNNNKDFPSLGMQSLMPATLHDVRTLESNVIAPSRNIPIPVTQPNKARSPSDSNLRRITPTAISPNAPIHNKLLHTAPTLLTTLNKADVEQELKTAFAVATESPMVSLEAERNILREARAKGMIPVVTEETTPQKTSRLHEMLAKQFTPTKFVLDKVSTVMDSLPELTNVTFQDRLDIMSELYSLCLKEYMVPNVTVELYFVVQLLTTRGLDADLAVSYFNQDDDAEVCYLASVHNAVYFAVSVLQKQQSLLSLLDKGTLRLIVDNQRVSDFCPTFRDELLVVIQKTRMKVRPLPPSSPVLGVSFQADTDNRKNFPNDRAFHTFKKQRDSFYELLREWQENHMQPGWSMRESHAAHIRDLVGYQIELTNHVHFARLFQSQLIMMCKGDRSHKVKGDDENISLLSELRLSNPAKFKRLQERFISPQSVGSPCPQPSFPGCQEFFRDFVIIASSHMFNHHLTHTMVERITELNGTPFSLPERESDQDVEVDPEDLEMMSMCLLTLRLLGKFLGFITFLPYQSSEKLPDMMEATLINMRNQVPLPVNPVAITHKCLQQGRTVLTMPWIVEFLSMMDSLAPRLDQLQQTLMLLVHVYRSVARELCAGRRTLTLLLVITSLGWLFELPVFPEGMFFKSFPYGIAETTQVYASADCVDKMDLVDHSLFFTCCPYLAEVKSLLMGFAVGSNNKGSSIRKITPMMTESDVTGSIFEKHLQAHLEESFFHNHPASMKRTLEFVADRVASNYIKKFRTRHLPKLVQNGSQKLKEIIDALGDSFDTRAKRKARQQVENFSLDLVTKAYARSYSKVFSYALTQSGAVLPLLLPEETSPQVIKVAAEISARLGMDKVVTWMSTHITKAMFVREYSPELEKYLKAVSCEQNQDVAGSSVGWESSAFLAASHTGSMAKDRSHIAPASTSIKHDTTGNFPSETLVAFKEVLRDLVLEEGSLVSDDLMCQVDHIRWCLENRQDINSGVFKCMTRMTIDMAYILAIRYPSLWTLAIREALIDIWKKHLRAYTNFSHIFCPKHMHLISTAPNDQLAWQNLCDLLLTLVRHELMTATDVETCGAVVTQTNIPAWMSTNIESFLSEKVPLYWVKANTDVTEETPGMTPHQVAVMSDVVVTSDVVLKSTDLKEPVSGQKTHDVSSGSSLITLDNKLPCAFVCTPIRERCDSILSEEAVDSLSGTVLPTTSSGKDTPCDSDSTSNNAFCDFDNASPHQRTLQDDAGNVLATVESAVSVTTPIAASAVGWSVVSTLT